MRILRSAKGLAFLKRLSILIHIMATNKSGKDYIAVNRKARHDYLIEQTFEAGLVLEGWEVKSLRQGRVQLVESYVVIRNQEAWMVGGLITPLLSTSTHVKPNPSRSRKLLLHRSEINKLIGKVDQKGYTLVVLGIYWKDNKVKAELALAKGKKSHDKRAALKERDWQLQKQRQFKGG